jgi:outer membrane lipoprotein-sorting protein
METYVSSRKATALLERRRFLMRFSRFLGFVWAFFAVCFLANSTEAATAEEIVAIVDANLTKVKDQTYTSEIKVYTNGKVSKTLNFTARLKGLQMKLIRFTAPGDVKGMTILNTADGNMYVYLPSYQRVRRMAAHVRNQGFMGTDLSAEDMGSSALSVGWNSKLLGEDAESWRLEVTPKPGNETSYAKLHVTVNKKHRGVSKMEYMNAQGKVVKTQERTEWKMFGPLSMPTLFTVKDQVTGSKTEMRFFDCKVNQGIPDDAFTKRAILRAD